MSNKANTARATDLINREIVSETVAPLIFPLDLPSLEMTDDCNESMNYVTRDEENYDSFCFNPIAPETCEILSIDNM